MDRSIRIFATRRFATIDFHGILMPLCHKTQKPKLRKRIMGSTCSKSNATTKAIQTTTTTTTKTNNTINNMAPIASTLALGAG